MKRIRNNFALNLAVTTTLVLCSFLSISQNEKYYFTKDWIHCDEGSAKYYRIIEEVDTLLKVTDYYMSGGKQFEGFVENKAKNYEVLKIRGDFEQKTVGFCTYYRKNGAKE